MTEIANTPVSIKDIADGAIEVRDEEIESNNTATRVGSLLEAIAKALGERILSISITSTTTAITIEYTVKDTSDNTSTISLTLPAVSDSTAGILTKEQYQSILSTIASKQDKLSAGKGISIDDDNEISVDGLTAEDIATNENVSVQEFLDIAVQDISGNRDNIDELARTKQDKLSAGKGISIDDDNKISVDGLTAEDIKAGEDSTVQHALNAIATQLQSMLSSIASKQDQLSAGKGISIDDDNKISVDGLTAEDITTNENVSVQEFLDIAAQDITDNRDSIDELTRTKQNKLISGTNIKTINHQSILGSGNIVIQGGGGESGVSDVVVDGQSVVTDGVANISLANTIKLTEGLTIKDEYIL